MAIDVKGASVVIGIQSTGEGSLERQDKQVCDGSIVSTCAEGLMNFIKNHMGQKTLEQFRSRIKSLRLPPNCLDLIHSLLYEYTQVVEV